MSASTIESIQLVPRILNTCMGVLCYIVRVIVRAGRRLDARANRRGYPPRKHLPAKRIPADIRSLCRSYTDEAVRSLAAIMRNGDKDATRVAAAAILLDRGWGKAQQDGNVQGEVRVTLRKMLGGDED